MRRPSPFAHRRTARPRFRADRLQGLGGALLLALAGCSPFEARPEDDAEDAPPHGTSPPLPRGAPAEAVCAVRSCPSTTTREDCGVCGRSCLGAPCEDGACVLPPVAEADGLVDVVARGRWLFVLSDGGRRLEAFDVDVAVPAPARAWSLGDGVSGVAAGDGEVLAVVRGVLRRYPVDAAPEDVGPVAEARAVVAGGGVAYVAEPRAGVVRRFDLVGRRALPPLEGLAAEHLALAGDTLVAAAGAALVRVDARGAHALETFDAPIELLAIGGTAAFVAVRGRLLRVSLEEEGAAPVVVARVPAGTSHLVGDARGVGWLAAPLGVCAVESALACGGSPRTLARDLGACRGLALTEAFVYVGAGRTVRRQPR